MRNSARTLVIGLGNPILGDDGVGWHVARALETEWKGRETAKPIAFETLSVGGLTLMEHMEGYERVLLLDAISSGERPLGSVSSWRLDELQETEHSHTRSTHDTSLQMALDVGRRLGVKLPETVWVVGVETSPDFVFAEQLSLPIAAAVDKAKDEALQRLEMWEER